jgi:hypothetical protein
MDIYIMEYYSAIKNKITLFSGKWMELEITILSEIRQTQKGNHHVCCHMWNLEGKKRHERRGTIREEKRGQKEGRDHRG